VQPRVLPRAMLAAAVAVLLLLLLLAGAPQTRARNAALHNASALMLHTVRLAASQAARR
jgi:hypothetical protein